MMIKKMTATFGRLEGAVVELTDGLNLLEAPNEGGKSTWCAFLRAMFYGIPTKERDRQGFLAEKNRYQPWSGSPMEGSVDLVWNGREVTLRRFPRGSVPFGGFEAVDTATGEPVPGLTAENAGETLIGVPREVFERSAFVGQSGVPVDGNPELEKRIAALVSSGEEDVSFSQTQRTLKDWQNRRRHNKSGLIPKLEGELEELDGLLARLDRVGRALAEAQGEKDALECKQAELTAEREGQQARADGLRRAEYDRAVGELTACRAELAALTAEAGPLTEKEALREAQGELVYYNTLGANLKIAENQRADAEKAAREAREAARDPLFPNMTGEQARIQAAADGEKAEKVPKATWTWLLLALGWAVLGALQLIRDSGNKVFGVAYLIFALAAVGRCLWNRKKRGERAAILARYSAADPGEIFHRAEDFAQRCRTADEAERAAQARAEALIQMEGQRVELLEGLLAFVRPFAPAVTDPFGISAALSRALSLDERVATARVKLEGAQRLVSSIPAPTGSASPDPLPPPSDHTPQQTAAMLAAVTGELGRAESTLAMARGERNTLGDPAQLEARRGVVVEQLLGRRAEYEALSLALEVLEEANTDLQARFSPALNRRAGELFSALTGGKYEEVSLTRDFEASARQTGAVLPRRAITLSAGTVDQLYLAVRLAVCEVALPAENPIPLVLDDALANFDDDRMALALTLLQTLAERRQILLFTCHRREGAWRRER